MSKYTATIRHHSISRARVIDAGNSLPAAKARASAEFGDGYLDHEIVIYEDTDTHGPCMVTSRRIGSDAWHDVED